MTVGRARLRAYDGRHAEPNPHCSVTRVLQRQFIVIGPTPPPLHGVAFSTVHMVDAVRRAGRLAGHLDTSDPRPLTTVGRLDLTNVRLAIVHTATLALLLARHPGAAVHVPLSQGRWGFLRDAVFIRLARLMKRPVIVHLHGGYFDSFYTRSSSLMRLLIRRTLDGVDDAWVLTPTHEAIFDGLVPRERVHVLQNTSDDIGMSPNGRPPRSGGGLNVLFLSNLLPEKGCLDLLDALLGIGEGAAGFHVRLVGEAERSVAGRVERLGRELSARGARVELAGPRIGAAKTAEFRWADVFVFPSRYAFEGQPIVLLEAMSAGIPIVSTDHSGIPYTVRDGREGLIVAPGDLAAIGKAIERLRDDPELRRRLGAAGRQRYERCYRPELFHAAVEDLLAVGDDGR